MITRKNYHMLALIVACLSNYSNAREGDGAREQYPDIIGPVHIPTQCCPATTFGLRNFSDYSDSSGKRYWSITNNSKIVLTAQSDREKIKISPGKTKRLYRDSSYSLNVYNAHNKAGAALYMETDNHSVTISQENGCLTNISE